LKVITRVPVLLLLVMVPIAVPDTLTVPLATDTGPDVVNRPNRSVLTALPSRVTVSLEPLKEAASTPSSSTSASVASPLASSTTGVPANPPPGPSV